MRFGGIFREWRKNPYTIWGSVWTNLSSHSPRASRIDERPSSFMKAPMERSARTSAFSWALVIRRLPRPHDSINLQAPSSLTRIPLIFRESVSILLSLSIWNLKLKPICKLLITMFVFLYYDWFIEVPVLIEVLVIQEESPWYLNSVQLP